TVFEWREAGAGGRKGSTVWSLFPADTKYFDPGVATFMINYRVENLDRVLATLRRRGGRVDARIEESEHGRFGWVIDPEGNRIELCQPPAARPARRRSSSVKKARNRKGARSRRKR